MIDQRLINLIDLIPSTSHLKRIGSTNGGEYAGACPFCGGKDRFRVWPNDKTNPRWWCRQCGKTGDALGFVMQFLNLDFKAACEYLHLDNPEAPRRDRNAPVIPASEYEVNDLKAGYACFEAAWQQAAGGFVEACADRLYEEWSGHAGRYLEGRGIPYSVALAANLGLNSQPHCSTWGSVEVYLPRGIVIPWTIEGQLWNVRVRRPNGDLQAQGGDKYISPKGCANGMYGISDLKKGDIVIMTEGEFDALVLKRFFQSKGRADVCVVSIGSNTGARVSRWLLQLSTLPKKVLVAFDNDEAGESAAQWWLPRLGKIAERYRPTKKDITEMYQAGELGWIEKEIA